MRLQARQFLTMTGLTAVEAIRQPICLLLVTTCTVLVSLIPFLITHTLGKATRLVHDSALALHMVCGLLLGCFLSSFSLTQEIKRGTADSILSKPVSRSCFFLARYCGITTVILIFSIAASISTVLAARIAAGGYFVDWWAAGPLLAATPAAFVLAAVNNYFTRRPFASNALALLILALMGAFIIAGFRNNSGAWVSFGSALPLTILPASVLATLAIMVLSAVALALATRLNALSTIAVCALIFILGLMSDYLFGRHAAGNEFMAALYYLLPNWQHFWVADGLSGAGIIPWHYVARVGLYALFYLASILCLGMLFFQRREIRS